MCLSVINIIVDCKKNWFKWILAHSDTVRVLGSNLMEFEISSIFVLIGLTLQMKSPSRSDPSKNARSIFRYAYESAGIKDKKMYDYQRY